MPRDLTRELEGIRRVRSVLPELLGLEAGRALDRRLVAALAEEASDERRVEACMKALDPHDAARHWVERFQSLFELGVSKGLFQEPPGRANPPAPPRYECPHKDFTWSRHSVGEPIPRCPTHQHVDLVLTA